MPTWIPNLSNYNLEFKKRIIILHCRNKTQNQISEIIGVSKPIIGAVIGNYKKYNFTNRKCSEYKEKLAVAMYTKTNIGGIKISRYLNIKELMFYSILKRNNIKRREPNHYRKYSLNEDFFNKIDNEEKAYLLGFLIADGCNSRDRITRISINKDDAEILEFFKKALKSNQQITESRDNMLNLNIYSRKLTEKLKEYGFIENKTYKTFFPNISENLKRHFIRGYFDGDGCITYSCAKIPRKKDKTFYEYIRPMVSIAGTESLLISIQDILIRECNLNKTKLIERKSIKILSYGGHNSITKIYNYLYKDSNLYLKRKKDKFEKYFIEKSCRSNKNSVKTGTSK